MTGSAALDSTRSGGRWAGREPRERRAGPAEVGFPGYSAAYPPSSMIVSPLIMSEAGEAR